MNNDQNSTAPAVPFDIQVKWVAGTTPEDITVAQDYIAEISEVFNAQDSEVPACIESITVQRQPKE